MKKKWVGVNIVIQQTMIENKIQDFYTQMRKCVLNQDEYKSRVPVRKKSLLTEVNLKQLSLNYLIFFNKYKPIIEEEIRKKPVKLEYNAIILGDMYSIYNELINFADLMSIGKLQESYERQKLFLNNQAFINLTGHLQSNHANRIIIDNKLLIMITILCCYFQYPNTVSDWNIEFKKHYLDIQNRIKNGELNAKQMQLYWLVEAFLSFVNKEIKNSFAALKNLFTEYINNADNESKRNVAIQYIGLGEHFYRTAYLPKEFKQYIAMTINDFISNNS